MLFKAVQLFVGLISLLLFKRWRGENLYYDAIKILNATGAHCFRNQSANFERATSSKLFGIPHVGYDGRPVPRTLDPLPAWQCQGYTRYFEAIRCCYFGIDCTPSVTSRSLSSKWHRLLCHAVRLSCLDGLPPSLRLPNRSLPRILLSNIVSSHSFCPSPSLQQLLSLHQCHHLRRTARFVNNLSLPFDVGDELRVIVWRCLSLPVVDHDEYGLYHKSQRHSTYGAVSYKVHTSRLQNVSNARSWTESDVYPFKRCCTQSARPRRPLHSFWFARSRHPRIWKRRFVGIDWSMRHDIFIPSPSLAKEWGRNRDEYFPVLLAPLFFFLLLLYPLFRSHLLLVV